MVINKYIILQGSFDCLKIEVSSQILGLCWWNDRWVCCAMTLTVDSKLLGLQPQRSALLEEHILRRQGSGLFQDSWGGLWETETREVHFSESCKNRMKREVLLANKQRKKMLHSSSDEGMQIKAITQYQFTTLRQKLKHYNQVP